MVGEAVKEHDNSIRFNLRDQFFVTTIVAIAIALCVRPIHPAFQGIGLSILLFLISRGAFAVSKRLPNVAREIVFLIGLPPLLAAVTLAFWSVALAIMEIVRHFAS